MLRLPLCQLDGSRRLPPLLLLRPLDRLCRQSARAARRANSRQQLLQPALHLLQHLQRRHAGIPRKTRCLVGGTQALKQRR